MTDAAHHTQALHVASMARCVCEVASTSLCVTDADVTIVALKLSITKAPLMSVCHRRERLTLLSFQSMSRKHLEMLGMMFSPTYDAFAHAAFINVVAPNHSAPQTLCLLPSHRTPET